MKRRFLNPDVARRISEMDSVFVGHREFDNAFKAIGTSIEPCGARKHPMCVQVRGPTGVGESTLRAKLTQAFADVADGSEVLEPPFPGMVADYKPLIQLDMPVDPSHHRVMVAILTAFGDPNPRERDAEITQSRVFRFVSACGCVGVLFDEAKRLVDGRGAVRARDTLDWFKTFAEAKGISIILLGVGGLEYLLRADAQVQRRWARPVVFNAYKWPEFDGLSVTHPDFRFTADQDEIVGVFAAMERLMPIPIHPEASIFNPDPVVGYMNAKRFFYSCRGLIGFHRKLLLSAMEVSNGCNEVTLELLGRGFCKAFLSEPGLVDPFGPEWHGQAPPPVRDHTLLLRPKRTSRPTKKEKQRELAEALTK